MFLDGKASEGLDLGAVLRALAVGDPSELHPDEVVVSDAVAQFSDPTEHHHKTQEQGHREPIIVQLRHRYSLCLCSTVDDRSNLLSSRALLPPLFPTKVKRPKNPFGLRNR